MPKMTLTPDTVWNAQEQRQINRIQPVQSRRSKERKVNEVVRNGVRIPPQPKRNQRTRRKGEQQRACANDKTTSTPSLFECRRTPVDAGMAATALAPLSADRHGAARRRAHLNDAELNQYACGANARSPPGLTRPGASERLPNPTICPLPASDVRSAHSFRHIPICSFEQPAQISTRRRSPSKAALSSHTANVPQIWTRCGLSSPGS
jgi:hypothetical protein